MRAESKRYRHYVQYIGSDNALYNNMMCEKLEMSLIPCLAHVLNLPVLAAMKIDIVVALVTHVWKMVHSFWKAPESMVALM